jgi:integrase
LVVARQGTLESTGDPFEPYRLLDRAGRSVGPVAAFLGELQGCGRPATTQRSYGMALLRWFRFLWAIDVAWDHATRVEARDFCRWIQIVGKAVPLSPGRRTSAGDAVAQEPSAATSGPTEQTRARGIRSPVAGKAAPGSGYAPTTRAHSETVLRGFYEFHLQAASGPMVNPFPLARGRQSRANEHHNPMQPFRQERSGLFRPRVVQRAPRQIPDERFNELFARLGSDRDRALVALWVSTGARASELLGVVRGMPTLASN